MHFQFQSFPQITTALHKSSRFSLNSTFAQLQQSPKYFPFGACCVVKFKPGLVSGLERPRLQDGSEKKMRQKILTCHAGYKSDRPTCLMTFR